MTGDWHVTEWPKEEECTPGCIVPYSHDGVCDEMCNNVMCGFDKGSCAGVVQGGSCYSSATPKKMTLDVCAHYADSSCCVHESEVEFVRSEIAGLMGSCQVESRCKSHIERLYCGACSPRSSEYYRDGTLQVCKDYGRTVYDDCATSMVAGAQNSSCVMVKERYPTAADFIAVFGRLESSTACLSETDDVASEPLSTTAIVGICVAVVVVVALASIITVLVICHKRHKKDGNDKSKEMDVVVLESDNKTLVPVEALGDDTDIIYAEPSVPSTEKKDTGMVSSTSSQPFVMTPQMSNPMAVPMDMSQQMMMMQQMAMANQMSVMQMGMMQQQQQLQQQQQSVPQATQPPS